MILDHFLNLRNNNQRNYGMPGGKILYGSPLKSIKISMEESDEKIEFAPDKEKKKKVNFDTNANTFHENEGTFPECLLED